MSDELEICLASLFLNKGKDVLTAKEFIMYVSLDLRWMQVKDADALLNIFLEKGLLSRTGDYVRPQISVSEANVPVAYRPSEALLKTLRSYSPKQAAAKKDTPSADLLSKLIQKAIDLGIGKGPFIAECNKISKKADVDMEVAALMILREKGVDVMPYLDDAVSAVKSR
jgi:hypothetical protein